jgi:uncharacterized DUF497 family protein
LWYSIDVEFEWDPAKALANLRKHGVPFFKACQVFKDAGRLEQPDFSGDHDEERWDVLGRVEDTVLFVVFTVRGERVRLISARRATRNEQRHYWAGDIPH